MNHTINEISKLYSIPKSTLRYWDQEGLISFDREPSTGYRQYTIKTIIDVGDVAYYRSLNMSIDEIKELAKKNAEDLEELFKNSRKKVEEQIKKLQETQDKIDTRLMNINLYRRLLENPYTFSKPNFKKLVKNNFENIYHQKYIEDPSSAALYIPREDIGKMEYTFISDSEQENQNIVWNIEETSQRFVYCLLRTENSLLNLNCLEAHQEFFKMKGFEMGNIVGRYLFSAYDQKSYDYHECWIEII